MKSVERKKLQEKLERELEPWRRVARKELHNKAWLREMRHALGVPATEVAHRMAVDRSFLYRMEAREKDGWVSLHDLAEAAEAMKCRLVYGLVPIRDWTVEETAASLKTDPQRETPRIVAKREKKRKKVWDEMEEWRLKRIWERAADEKAAEVRARVLEKAKSYGWSVEAAEKGNQARVPESGPGAPTRVARTAEEMRRQGVSPVQAVREALREYEKECG